jgi:hypothetical protein
MKKSGIRPKPQPQRNVVPPQEEEESQDEEPLISQVSMHFGESQPLLSQLTNTMLSHLVAEVTTTTTNIYFQV